MLINKWNNLLSITITTLFIILITRISPVVASSKSTLSIPQRDLSFPPTTVLANNSLTAAKQQQSILFGQLNLTSSQKKQITQIHSQYQQQIRKKKNNLEILQQQLSDLMVGTESVESIRAKNKQLVNLRQEIGDLKFESMLATREILTPQQRYKFREIIESQLNK